MRRIEDAKGCHKKKDGRERGKRGDVNISKRCIGRC